MKGSWLICVAACGRIGFDVPGEAGENPTSDAFDTSDALGELTNANVVFVTKTGYSVGAFGGIAAADQACMDSARAAGLPGTFVAWLSSTTVDAKTRLGAARGWVRRDGLPFTDTVADLFAGHFYYAPILDETGAARNGVTRIASGTYPDGTVSMNYNCHDYTTGTAASRLLLAGYLGSGTQSWTNEGVTAFCNMPYPMYCFENDRDYAITKPTGTTRRAFLSTGSFPPTAGIAAADAMCATEASNAGLPGTFAAAIAGDGTTAASRFTVGVPWSRMDGAVVTGDFTAQLAALNVTVDGAYQNDSYVWIGAPTPTTAGTPDSTCANWTTTDNTFHGGVGYAGRTGSQGLFGFVSPCNQPEGYQVYCFQQ